MLNSIALSFIFSDKDRVNTIQEKRSIRGRVHHHHPETKIWCCCRWWCWWSTRSPGTKQSGLVQKLDYINRCNSFDAAVLVWSIGDGSIEYCLLLQVWTRVWVFLGLVRSGVNWLLALQSNHGFCNHFRVWVFLGLVRSGVTWLLALCDIASKWRSGYHQAESD